MLSIIALLIRREYKGGEHINLTKASVWMFLNLLCTKTGLYRVNKNMALHLDSVYTAFLFSFLSLLAHSLPCTSPPAGPISSGVQSPLCTPESEVLVSPKESDETRFWFFQASVGSSFQNICS